MDGLWNAPERDVCRGDLPKRLQCWVEEESADRSHLEEDHAPEHELMGITNVSVSSDERLQAENQNEHAD